MGEAHEIYFLQDRILVMHESPLICPLLKITPKASRATSTDETEEADNVAKEKTASGFALGKLIARELKPKSLLTRLRFHRIRLHDLHRYPRIRRLISCDQKPRAS